MVNIKTYHNQILFDLACQLYGHIEGIVWLLEDNPGVSIDSEFSSLKIRPEVIKQEIVSYFKNKGISITTSIQVKIAIDEHDEFTNEFNFEFN